MEGGFGARRPVVFQPMATVARSPNPEMPGTPHGADAVPPTVQLAYLATFGLLLAAYFFVIFCVARGLLRGIGFGISELVQCFGMTLVMAGFIVWLAPLTQLMELWYGHRVPSRRAKRGLCPACGHPIAAAETSTDGSPPACPPCCPECGSDLQLRSPMQFGWETIRRFAVVCTLAYLVGCFTGLAWLHLDERAFRLEYLAKPTVPHERKRAWPASFSTLIYDGSRAWSFSITEPDVRPLDRDQRQRRDGDDP